MFDSLFNLFTFSLFILQLSTSWVWQRQSLRFSFMGSCFSSIIKADSPFHNVPSTSQADGDVFLSSTLKRFSFFELKTATGNFDNMVAQGRFASVFKGWVDENSLTAANPGTGMVVAVKRIHGINHCGISDRAYMKWLTEMNYAQRLHHPNLVKLIGYCSEIGQLLVYEFMPCGSLDCYLSRRGSNSQPLSWTVRMKIALDAAKVLAFFHSDEAKVIYRNFESSNILLDSDYNAKLCSLSLATRTDTSCRKVRGTSGYVAPEYLATGYLSAKCDVYGFGVVMLEMMTGRRALDRNRPSMEYNLVEWAKPYLVNKRRVRQIIDFSIEGTYTAAAARKAAKLVSLCLSKDPQDRPNMNDVVKTLEQLQKSSGPRQNPHAISSNGPKHWRRNVDGTNNSTTATHSRPSAHRNT